MEVETMLTETDEERGSWITISGSGIERILKTRSAFRRVSQSGGAGGTPSEICKTLITNYIASQMVSPKDVIPKITIAGNVPGTPIVYKTNIGDTLLDSIISVCKIGDIGFKMIMPYEGTSYDYILFQNYAGVDRSYAQTKNPWVVFSQSAGSLNSSNSIYTTKNYYNTIIVLSGAKLLTSEVLTDKDFVVVEADSSLTGSKRRILVIEESSIVPNNLTETRWYNEGPPSNPGYPGIGYSDATFYDKLRTAGLKALSKYAAITVVDGEVDPTNDAKMNVDYFLGDIVQFVDQAGNRTRARASEFIWTHDGSEIKQYPTFTMLPT